MQTKLNERLTIARIDGMSSLDHYSTMDKVFLAESGPQKKFLFELEECCGELPKKVY